MERCIIPILNVQNNVNFAKKDGNETTMKHKTTMMTLASIPLIMTLGNSMLIPVLPLLEKQLSISKLQSSYIITAYSFVTVFFIPLAGYLSDRFGRKMVMIPALILTGCGGLIAGLAAAFMDEAFGVIILGRILQGIGAAGAMPIVLPLVGDLYKRDTVTSEVLGIIETSNTIGKVLSPILGAALTALVWYLPFFAIPLLALFSIVCMFLFIKVPKNKTSTPLPFRTYWQQIKAVFREHKTWLIAVFIIGAAVMFILFGFLFYLSSILEEQFSFNGVSKGLLLAIPLFALALASYITGKKIGDAVKRMKWLIFIGVIICGMATLVVPFCQHYLPLLATFFVSGVGIGMTLPCLDALITENISKQIRGAITSIYSATRYAGVALGPPLIAFLMDKTLWGIIIIFVILSAGAAYLAYNKIATN